MIIAMDADDMSALARKLSSARAEIADANPRMPAAHVFGPAILGVAVEAFAAAVHRRADEVGESCDGLEKGVRLTLDDMSDFEAGAVADLQAMDPRQ